jgi:hypothetical protein
MKLAARILCGIIWSYTVAFIMGRGTWCKICARAEVPLLEVLKLGMFDTNSLSAYCSTLELA